MIVENERHGLLLVTCLVHSRRSPRKMNYSVRRANGLKLKRPWLLLPSPGDDVRGEEMKELRESGSVVG